MQVTLISKSPYSNRYKSIENKEFHNQLREIYVNANQWIPKVQRYPVTGTEMFVPFSQSSPQYHMPSEAPEVYLTEIKTERKEVFRSFLALNIHVH